ncbi:hypothetical protein HUG15_04355 [Salicibibacter cibarius]|uniref:DUF4190 domain-containing protein n=1 Tax=Salicibibacter cibarius TaxID=2743000 RepID=A0A7T7CAH6_9BACI|nr:hypothetical protein [Salicibibacter cibarius]QQK74909.1 hypothetical protein HUG15_04355 [Salicibibacter cibarius]
MENQTAVESKPKSGMATAAFILGLVNLIFWLIPILGFPIGIVAIILGALSLKAANRWAAITGIVVGAITFILTLINAVLGALMFM